MRDSRATLAPGSKGTERAFQSQVIELARLLGWRVAHFRPAKTARGWRTPVQADGAGFPDLTLVRGGRLVFVELKSGRGRLSDAQRGWLTALQAAGVETYVARPADLDALVAILRQPTTPDPGSASLAATSFVEGS